MIEPRTDYERWMQLVDRQADDQVLTEDELAFCRNYEQANPLCQAERAAYEQLTELDGAPTAASRALVDRALQQLEAEDAEQAIAAAQLLRGPRMPQWLALSAVVAVGLGSFYAWRANRSDEAGRLAAISSKQSQQTAQPLARAELVFTAGSVKVSSADTGVRRALLREGSVVETDAGAACVLIDSDINVCLAAHSRVQLTAITSAARRIELEAGKVATRLSTQPEGMSLSITVDGVASTAVGTAFSVERTAEQVITTVLNGKVRVGRGDDNVIVNAHERAVRNRAHAAVTSVSRAEEAPLWALLAPTVLWHDPVTASLEVRGTPAGAEAWLDEQLIGVTPLYSLIPVGQHRLVVRKGAQELATRELHVGAGSAQEVVYAAAQTQSELAPQPSAIEKVKTSAGADRKAHASRVRASNVHTSITTETDAQQDAVTAAELLRRARQSVRSGGYAEAARTYETLIKNFDGSDEAQTALVLLGQLRLTRLQDARGALHALDNYLKAGGALELEASAARIEALHQLGRNADEARAIEEFLQHHPRSFEAKALRARSADTAASP